MADFRHVQCPLCHEHLTASSEEECITHIRSCDGFRKKHGESARKDRLQKRQAAFPRAAVSAKEENRTMTFSNDGTFSEKIPAALLDVLHWWEGTQKSMGTRSIDSSLKNVPRPWVKDDGTDRHYWWLLISKHPEFSSIYASNDGPPPSLIAHPTMNQSQTAREQCKIDGSASFHPSEFCSLCSLPAMERKARCACRKAYYCSQRCQKAHWKRHRSECKKMQKAWAEKLKDISKERDGKNRN